MNHGGHTPIKGTLPVPPRPPAPKPINQYSEDQMQAISILKHIANNSDNELTRIEACKTLLSIKN